MAPKPDVDISEQSVRAHYAMLLGVGQQWEIERVEIDQAHRSIEVWARWRRGEALMCPKCRAICPGYDHLMQRTWKHLDACGFTTKLHARIPRCRCEMHGVISVRCAWAEPGSRYTLEFERYAIDVIKGACSLQDAAQLLRLDWDAVARIQRRAVERGLARRMQQSSPRLGIDEKSFGKGQSYGTVLSDLSNQCVVEVVQGRDEKAAAEALGALSQAQALTVEAVAMDMWKPFINATQLVLPQADVVFDKFHIMRLLQDGIDTVRRQEHRLLYSQGDTTLAGSKYLWLKSPANQSPKQWKSFKALLALNLKAGRAWILVETFRGFWDCEDSQEAQSFFKDWFSRAKRSKLEPIKAAADTIKRHLYGILTYFKHRITNAAAEGLNSIIQTLRCAARGFRNFANYRATILFHLGKLSLKPITTHTFA